MFQMYTCALIYTVCLCHTCGHSGTNGTNGEKGGFPARRTHICHVNQADLSNVLVRVLWTGEHRKDKPIGLVEPPNTCLQDAQNQIRKAAFLS